MGRTRQLGLRRHKATGAHYITLPNGQFKYFSKDPATAERQYAAWIDEKYNAPSGLSQAQPVPAPAALETVRDVFNAYLKFIKANRSPKYFEDMKVPLQEFCDTAAPATTKLTALKKEHFIAWREGVHQRVQAGKVSAFWANKRIRALRAAFRRAMKDYTLTASKSHIDELLFTLYQMPEPMPDSQPFPPDAIQKILDRCGVQLKAMILLALNGCLDNIDISRIQWESMDLSRCVVDYPRKKPNWKATRPRRFRLWDRTRRALEAVQPVAEQRKGRVFSTHHGCEWVRPNKDSIIQEFTKLKRAAGITQKENFRNLRKSAVTAAAVAGVGEVTIEMLLGHASPKMWRRYAGVVPPAVEEAIQKIEQHFFGAENTGQASADQNVRPASPEQDAPGR